MAVIFGDGAGQGEGMPHECLQPGGAVLMEIKPRDQPHNAGVAG